MRFILLAVASLGLKAGRALQRCRTRASVCCWQREAEPILRLANPLESQKVKLTLTTVPRESMEGPQWYSSHWNLRESWPILCWLNKKLGYFDGELIFFFFFLEQFVNLCTVYVWNTLYPLLFTTSLSWLIPKAQYLQLYLELET